MKIIVVGCGKVGRTIITQLSAEGHEVTVIDKSADRLKTVTATLDIMTYVGDGTSYTVLHDAGIENANLLIAVMNSDETNLLCAVIAKKASRCKTIARVRNPVYSTEIDFLKRELDIDMIFNPEQSAAEAISRIFNFPYATSIDVFSNRKVEMVHFKIRLDSKLSKLKVMDIRSKYKCNVLVATVKRQDSITIPGGDFTLEEGDEVGLVAERKYIHEFFKMFGEGTRKLPDAMIVGGGKIGYYLGRSLIESGIKVKIVESDHARCEFLSESLPEAEIICGDGTDRSLLMEEGLEHSAGFAALTSIDEENILLSLFAKSKVASKTVTKINRINFDEVVSQLNLDTIVNPNQISADRIIQYVRSLQYTLGSNIENYRKLFGGGEALEFIVKQNSDVVGIPLQNLNRKKNVLICCITRGDRIIIPGGQDSITVGDRVVIVHTDSEIHNLDDILA